MDGHDDLTSGGAPDESVPRGNVSEYCRALKAFRTDDGIAPEEYLAAVIDAALLLTNPGSCMFPLDDYQAHSELWGFGAAVWASILTVGTDSGDITADEVLDIVAARFQYEFIATPTRERVLAEIDATYSEIIEREFGVAASRVPVRDMPNVRQIANLITDHARDAVYYLSR